VPNEDEELEKKRKALLNSAKTFEVVNRSIHEIHESEGSIIEQLSIFKNEMERLGAADAGLEKIAQRLSNTLFDLEDITMELRDFSSTIDLDPASLEATEQRRDLISKLKRKYGPDLETVFHTHELLEQQLVETTGIEEKIIALEADMHSFLVQIRHKSCELSESRKTAGQSLSRLAANELLALEMGKARFEVAFLPPEPASSEEIAGQSGEKIGPTGMDKVRFLLSANPGEALKPLAKIASGGELSRIVLALKAVLSGTQSMETLIFDEVDAGIGGATSEKVGLKLKQLSQSRQVICITHLAQIAKYAENQFRIFKQVSNDRTFTSIVPLENETERVEEIARMIGGTTITPATLTHARELLDQALP
jgi:DNA repair protein RecN (Recombination protein N)